MNIKSSLSTVLAVLGLLAASFTSISSARADSERDGWVYQNWESVKAGVAVNSAGTWYAWGSLYFGGSIVDSADHNLLWVRGQLNKWDGAKEVPCQDSGWFHPPQNLEYAITNQSTTCGAGWYRAVVNAYSRVSTLQNTYEFHGGSLGTEWVWINH